MKSWIRKPVRLVTQGVGCLNTLHPMDVHKVPLVGKPGMTGQTTTFRVRQVDYRPLIVRCGTCDFTTLRSTFIAKYHLPPRSLPERPTILDLGSNVGYTICHFGYIYPDCRIVGIEMDADNFQIAQRNVAGIANCTLLNRAVSVANGVVSYRKGETDEDAYRISDQSKASAEAEIKVQCSTIQTIMDECGLKQIDYLKMDVEGEESRIFDESISDLSWLSKVRMLNVEVHYSPIEDILQILRARGFDAWKDTRHWSAVVAVRN